MGAWGTGPFDNDTAGDWFIDIERTLVGRLEETFGDNGAYDEWFAAAEVLTRFPEFVLADDARDAAIQRLRQLLRDPPQDWNTRQLERQYQEKVRGVLDKLVAMQRRERRRMSRRRW